MASSIDVHLNAAAGHLISTQAFSSATMPSVKTIFYRSGISYYWSMYR